MTDIVDVYLVAAGKYHDIDFARLELLKLLASHEEIRVTTVSDYENVEEIEKCSFMISYTCDVRPSERAQSFIRKWVESGGRWMALHGTNSALDMGGENGVDSPRCFPVWAETLGSQFVAHPPIAPYPVEIKVIHQTGWWQIWSLLKLMTSFIFVSITTPKIYRPYYTRTGTVTHEDLLKATGIPTINVDSLCIYAL